MQKTAAFQAADEKVQQQLKKNKKTIVKAKPYFEAKAKFDKIIRGGSCVWACVCVCVEGWVSVYVMLNTPLFPSFPPFPSFPSFICRAEGPAGGTGKGRKCGQEAITGCHAHAHEDQRGNSRAEVSCDAGQRTGQVRRRGTRLEI